MAADYDEASNKSVDLWDMAVKSPHEDISREQIRGCRRSRRRRFVVANKLTEER